MKVFQGWTNALRLMGPAFLVSVAYLDPGNWATAIEGGSRFGYDLVWVVVLSNLIAILLQTLAARLGLVTGKHLAQHCRHEYPPLVSVLLWMLCEVSIVALDLTMVIGTAVGLNLLFRLPLLQCILLSGLDSLLLLMMVPSLGLRRGELVTVGLILVVVCCFLWDLVLSKPPITEVLGGLWPRLSRDSLYTAVSLLGANVMPHNFYLHSALVSGQASQIGHGGCSVSDLCRYNLIDISAALGIALLVNVAVMLVAAAAFNSVGITVSTLQDAHDVMEQLLSSSIAPAVFGMALLCAGQLSTFTGTISGQVVLKGFMNIKLTVWVRRLLTRSAAILPAAIVQIMYGSAAIYQMLLIAQVVLALQLPFTLVPLIKITSSPRHMGAFANSRVTQAAAWGAAVIIFAANLLLCMELIWPTPSVAPAPPRPLSRGRLPSWAASRTSRGGEASPSRRHTSPAWWRRRPA
uniref:Manganese transport protein n=1 Tax=Tetraselmis sp. GSL018 TaxID=582737 RepID=A0A061SL89_9CHLO